MPISLPHLGECIFSEMANRKPFEIAQALGLFEELDHEHVKRTPFFARHECKLSPHGKFSFDGASRVDVALWIRPNLAVGLELKLGTTRLTKSRIDDEFLQPCRPSHQGNRLAGNMMAILDRRFGDHAPEDGLEIKFDNSTIPLDRNWILVTHQATLDRWIGNDKPSFSNQTSRISIQQVVHAFGGETPFNNLVSELLAINYYNTWIAPEAEQGGAGNPAKPGA